MDRLFHPILAMAPRHSTPHLRLSEWSGPVSRNTTEGSPLENDRNREFTLSGWKGGTYGFRVDAETRCRTFLPLKDRLSSVRFVLPGHKMRPCCRLTKTFWTTCPEFRSAEIGKWMEARGDKPWPRGHPPKYRAQLEIGDGETAEIRVFV